MSRHFIVTGRQEWEDDQTVYVVATSVADAQDVFVAWMEADVDDIVVAAVTEVSGPPLRIHTRDDIFDNPEPIT